MVTMRQPRLFRFASLYSSAWVKGFSDFREELFAIFSIILISFASFPSVNADELFEIAPQRSDWYYIEPYAFYGQCFASEGDAVSAYVSARQSSNAYCNFRIGGTYFDWPNGSETTSYHSYCIGDKYSQQVFSGFVHAEVKQYKFDYELKGSNCQGTSSERYNFARQFDYFCPKGYVFAYNANRELVCRRSEDRVPEFQPPNCPAVGNPISPATGNKYQKENDYRGVGTYPLSFERYYNSLSPMAAAQLGKLWRHTFDRAIKYSKTPSATSSIETAYAYRPNGQVFIFNRVANGTWETLPEFNAKLQRTTDASGATTGWLLTSADDELEAYDANGLFVSISNGSGVVQTLAYLNGKLSTVTDSFGRRLAFGYDAAGHLVTLTDPANGVFTYSYDAADNLVSVKSPDSNIRTYIYNEPANTSGANLKNALTGIVDQNGTRFATYQYDTSGRAITSEHAGGFEKVALTYTALNSTTVSYFKDSPTTASTTGVFSLQAQHGIVKTTAVSQPCAACGSSSSQSMVYDANGNVVKKTDFNGNVSCYAYDLTRNLETVRLEGLPPNSLCPIDLTAYVPPAASVQRKVTTQWHPSFRLPQQVAEPLRLIRYLYHGDSGVACGATRALCRKTQQETGDRNGGAGFAAVPTSTLARVWNYTYNAKGQVLTEDGPLSGTQDQTAYTYFANGDLNTVSVPGQATTLTTTYANYDANGRPKTITDPNGIITTLTYDALGRELTRTVNGKKTTTQYYPTGQVKMVIRPDGFMAYSYTPAHLLDFVTDQLGNKWDYDYDLAGNLKSVLVYDGTGTLFKQKTLEYNNLNLVSRITEGAAAPFTVTQFDYFPNGELKTITEAPGTLNQITRYTYDSRNQIDKVTDPLGGVTDYNYHPLGALESVTADGVTTSYTYNGFYEKVKETGPNRGAVAYAKNVGGQTASVTDAKSNLMTATYDGFDRPLSQTWTGSSNTYSYDTGLNGKGRLGSVTRLDGTDSTVVNYTYDGDGRITQKSWVLDGKTFTFRYEYRPANLVPVASLLSATVYPSGRRIENTYAQNTRTVISTDSVDSAGRRNIVGFFDLLNPAGLEFGGYTFGNGVWHTKSFDTRGYLDTLSYGGAIGSLYHTYTQDGQINSIQENRSNVFSTSTYGYDNDDHLTSASGKFGTFGWTVQPDDDRLTETLSGVGSTYTYTAASQKLASVSGGLIRNYGYDANGSVTSDGRFTYVYNVRGELTEVRSGTTRIATYRYDPFGRRIKKTGATAAQTGYFFYDDAGHLVAEADGAGVITKEYVYVGDTPVAMFQQPSTLYLIYVNHLNAPISMTLATSQTPVWSVNYYKPFGEAVLNPSSVTLNLRLPGQYLDAETGLHYNMARYYDPATGRYLQSDPIGLKGGINTYAYVVNNPLQWVDPLGLCLGGSCHGDQFLDWYNPDPYRSTEPPVPDAKPGIPPQTNSGTRQWEKTGGIDDANKDFDDLGPTDVDDKGDGVRVGKLPNGDRIIVRPKSSSGDPTIEIQRPDGRRSKDKVRYCP